MTMTIRDVDHGNACGRERLDTLRLRFAAWRRVRKIETSQRIDLEDMRDDLLRDIGLFDRPDLCLRRSELEPRRER